MTSMVVARNIVKTFGRKRALNSINFEIRERFSDFWDHPDLEKQR